MSDEVEILDEDGLGVAVFRRYDEPYPRIGETVVIDDPVDRDEVRVEGVVEDVRHYPSERLVVIELDTTTEQGGNA